MSYKIALMSDIHGNILALQAVLKELDRRKINRQDTFVLGDLVGYGPRPNEVIDCLRHEKIKSILGNYDEAVGFYLPTCGCKENSLDDKVRMENSLGWTAEVVTKSNKAYLRDLEETLELEYQGIKVNLVHGSPFSINEYVYEDDLERQDDIFDETDFDVIALGHTHIPYVKYKNKSLLVNPGSVGRPKDGDNRASFCIVNINLELAEPVSVETVRLAYDYALVAEEIRQSGLLNIFASNLETGRAD